MVLGGKRQLINKAAFFTGFDLAFEANSAYVLFAWSEAKAGPESVHVDVVEGPAAYAAVGEVTPK
jgi:hypothetical protein